MDKDIHQLIDSTIVKNDCRAITAERLNGLLHQMVNSSVQLPLSIKYAELVELRNNGALAPGRVYRITDYRCTTTDEESKALDNQFDIIVLATSESAINETAIATHHMPDVIEEVEVRRLYKTDMDSMPDEADLGDYFEYEGTMNVDEQTLCLWRKYEEGKATSRYILSETIDYFDNASIDNPIYPYGNATFDSDNEGYESHTEDAIVLVQMHKITNIPLSDRKIDAWQLKYCLDNDKTRFAWADTAGTGVIYYLKDEYANEAPYDHVNMQFKRYMCTSGVAAGTYIPSITDNSKISIDTEDFVYKSTFGAKCCNNSIKPCIIETLQRLNNITLADDCNNNTFGNNCWNNAFGNDCDSNAFGNNCQNNAFGNNCQNNAFGNSCYSNAFGNSCYGNAFGNSCSSNAFGNSCSSNTFGNNCGSNVFGNNCWNNAFGENCWNNAFGENCQNNAFGNSCSSNAFGNDCDNNAFGNNCDSNVFGNNCWNNAFGENCQNNAFGNSCNNNAFGNSCSSNAFGNSCSSNAFGNSCSSNAFGNSCYNNAFGEGCYDNQIRTQCNYNILGIYCYSNSFGTYCHGNSLGNECSHNSFGNNCNNNAFGNDCGNNAFGNNCNHNAFGNYCQLNSFGSSCANNSFGNFCHQNVLGDDCRGNAFGNYCSSNTLPAYCRRNRFGDGCYRLKVNNTATASDTQQVQNYVFANGLNAGSSAELTIEVERARTYETKVALNTSGALKMYCEADLV